MADNLYKVKSFLPVELNLQAENSLKKNTSLNTNISLYEDSKFLSEINNNKGLINTSSIYKELTNILLKTLCDKSCDLILIKADLIKHINEEEISFITQFDVIDKLKNQQSNKIRIALITNKTNKLFYEKSGFGTINTSTKKILYTGTHIEKYKHLSNLTHHPLIEISPVKNKNEIDDTLKKLDAFNWIIFTSPYSVIFFFKRVNELQIDFNIFKQIKIASIGQYTSKHLNSFDLTAEIQPLDESSDGLIKQFKKINVTKCKILIPRSDIGLNKLPDALEALGNTVIKLAIYQNRLPQNINKINPEDFDQIILTSPSCVNNFIKIYSKFPEKPEIIAKGKETKNRLLKLGYKKKVSF